MTKLTTDQTDKIDKKRKRVKRKRRLALKTKVMGNKKPTRPSATERAKSEAYSLYRGLRGLFGNYDQYSKEWMEIFKKEFFRWIQLFIKELFWVSIVVLSVFMILEWLGIIGK